MGWKCLVIWDCQTADVKKLGHLITNFLEG
jgi:G:T-mismatch repair DNA endonuclease (very short patch repair protein)